jgi:A-kinase anchor protein 1, mitochondrial
MKKKKTIEENQQQRSVEEINIDKNLNQPVIESDKLSETSSDSGNGQSEAYLNHEGEQDDCCLDEVIEEEEGVIQTNEEENDINNNNNNNINSNSKLKKSNSSSNITDKILPSNDSDNNNSKMPTSKSTNFNSNNNHFNKNTPKKSSTTIFNKKNSYQKQMSASQSSDAVTTSSSSSSSSNSLTSKNKQKINRQAKLSTTSSNSSDNYQDLVVYEFNFPRVYCGKLIGKNGVHVDFIRSKTQTQIAVRNDPNLEEQQIVCVSGRLEDVDRALDLISNRFPAKQYPEISFKPISKPIVYRRYNPEKSDSIYHEPKVFVAPNMYVDLNGIIMGNQSSLINVNVTAVVSTSQVFIQLPTNPTYDNLQKLDENMLKSYSNIDESIPLMIEPIEFGTICVAPTSYGWHRAMVTNYQSLEDILKTIPDYKEQCGLATVKFLDYGGYLTIPTNQLRQLRSDFMLLPFQAIECYLDGIMPYEGYEEEGKNYLSQLIKSSQLQVEVTGYADDGVPLVKLFLSNEQHEDFNVNNELVTNGFAYYINSPIVN